MIKRLCKTIKSLIDKEREELESLGYLFIVLGTILFFTFSASAFIYHVFILTIPNLGTTPLPDAYGFMYLIPIFPLLLGLSLFGSTDIFEENMVFGTAIMLAFISLICFGIMTDEKEIWVIDCGPDPCYCP